MTSTDELVSPVVGTRGFFHRVVVGSFALAMLYPSDAFAMDSTPKVTPDRTGYVLPLPPVQYLDSMRWMDWKSSSPVFKIDTLLLPNSTQPGVLRLPADYEPDLSRVS